MRALVVLLLLADVAHADRGVHGSAGVGGTFLTSGGRGDRGRLEATLDLSIRSRYGVLLGWRAFDTTHDGLLTAGLSFEAAAARPRLVIALHADAGADLDARAPLAGAGIRLTVGVLGPLGVVLDGGGYLVIDGDDTRLQIQSSLLLAARW